MPALPRLTFCNLNRFQSTPIAGQIYRSHNEKVVILIKIGGKIETKVYGQGIARRVVGITLDRLGRRRHLRELFQRIVGVAINSATRTDVFSSLGE